MGICVVIPAYNAAASIRQVALEVLHYGLPLLVVDDGSTDATAAAIDDLPVHLSRHPRNLGKGAALRTGFAWGLEQGLDGIITIDADGQHDPAAIPRLMEFAAVGGYDILLASRTAQFEEMAGLRRHWNRFGAWCMKKRTGFDISDSQSGFRYYSARMLRGLNLAGTGYDLEMEILMKAWKNGYRIGSMPVAARVADGRATSHFRPVRDTWRICRAFLRNM